MIAPFGTAVSSIDWTIRKALDHLSGAHLELARQGKRLVEAAAGLGINENWATNVKRIGRTEGYSDHNLAEIINICATVERLIETLEWARSSRFSDWRVELCNASHTGERNENDLVLVERCDGRECRARFEVSDVAGSSDSNHKEKKDLASLLVLLKSGRAFLPNPIWPKDDVFLAIHKDFADRLHPQTGEGRRPAPAFMAGTPPFCYYEQRGANGDTVILEVENGHSPSRIPSVA